MMNAVNPRRILSLGEGALPRGPTQLCDISSVLFFSLNFVVVDWCRGRCAAGGVTSAGADSGHPGGKHSLWFS